MSLTRIYTENTFVLNMLLLICLAAPGSTAFADGFGGFGGSSASSGGGSAKKAAGIQRIGKNKLKIEKYAREGESFYLEYKGARGASATAEIHCENGKWQIDKTGLCRKKRRKCDTIYRYEWTTKGYSRFTGSYVRKPYRDCRTIPARPARVDTRQTSFCTPSHYHSPKVKKYCVWSPGGMSRMNGGGITGETGDDMFQIKPGAEGFFEYVNMADDPDDLDAPWRLTYLKRTGGEDKPVMIPSGPPGDYSDFERFAKNVPKDIVEVGEGCYPAGFALCDTAPDVKPPSGKKTASGPPGGSGGGSASSGGGSAEEIIISEKELAKYPSCPFDGPVGKVYLKHPLCEWHGPRVTWAQNVKRKVTHTFGGVPSPYPGLLAACPEEGKPCARQCGDGSPRDVYRLGSEFRASWALSPRVYTNQSAAVAISIHTNANRSKGKPKDDFCWNRTWEPHGEIVECDRCVIK